MVDSGSVWIWPIVIVLGWFISGEPGLAVFILGPVNILVAVIPVVWAYFLAQRKLAAGSIARKWRIFGFSLTITPILIIITEAIVLILIGLLLLLLISVLGSIFPTFGQTISDFADQLAYMQANGVSQDELNAILRNLW